MEQSFTVDSNGFVVFFGILGGVFWLLVLGFLVLRLFFFSWLFFCFFIFKIAVGIRVTECLTTSLQRFPGLSLVQTEFQ